MLFIRTCAIGLKDSLCSGVRNLANAIWNGTIDQHLTQPGNVLSKNLVDENVQVLPVILAWGVVTGTLWTLLRPHAPAWLIVTFGVSGGLILFSMELILMSLTFWNIHPGQLHWMLFFVEEQYAQYPLTIFHPVIQAALTFLIPIGFVAFYPVASLYPVQVPMGISPPAWVPYLVAVVLLTLALVIWKAGLDRYTSTGT
ncbi:ABC-2 type transport system permease protein [Alicyclobacillus macrosporangiidus]|uniref:ABC-2 type transport system permease protein n=2 Tax=Alicyclobacillus macrosporangiidus TaxID=392015 RepID=A0A1I7GB31_9BACL|nr:ABC-2 type transport system permease protein [Alicyclobacillus macrosporangiidus]